MRRAQAWGGGGVGGHAQRKAGAKHFLAEHKGAWARQAAGLLKDRGSGQGRCTVARQGSPARMLPRAALHVLLPAPALCTTVTRPWAAPGCRDIEQRDPALVILSAHNKASWLEMYASLV